MAQQGTAAASGTKGGSGDAPAQPSAIGKAVGKVKLYVTHNCHCLGRDWVHGQIVEVEQALAEAACKFWWQVGERIVYVARPVTPEDEEVRKLEAVLAAAKTAPPTIPSREELAGLPLEQLRALGTARGVPGAEKLGQTALIDALTAIAAQVAADAPTR